jgi:regulatory protein
MLRQRSLSPQQALQKLRHYCDYQERCHQEVREKLYSLGLHKPDVETAVATLIQEDRLNEERFAILFAGGRFRLKNWGKVKIRYELKQKQVSDYCIRKALAAIDESDYGKVLADKTTLKWEALASEPDPFIRRQKVRDYLVQKGFEPDRINAAINTVANGRRP